MDQQITELQTRLAFLEDSIDGLTRTVVEQQQQIVDLQRQIDQLQEQLRMLTPSNIDTEIDVTPPHY